MQADAECYECCRNKVNSLMEQYGVDSEKQNGVLKKVDAYLDGAKRKAYSAPEILGDVLQILNQATGIQGGYGPQKEKYNQLLLSRYSSMVSQIQKNKDPLKTALQFALVGNYIDFGAMDDVQECKLEELLGKRESIVIDEAEYTIFNRELKIAQRLVYITDNAGEIVMDRILIEAIQRKYPQVTVTVIVRGTEVLNDATEQDAKDIKLDCVAEIRSNGTYYPGTPFANTPQEIVQLIQKADICIAKGQGNFESLCGCASNIYYLFLCKCHMFVNRFQVPRFTPVFRNEHRLVEMHKNEG